MGAEYINPQWRLPNEKTGNDQGYSMNFQTQTIPMDASINDVLTTGTEPFSWSIWFNVESVSNTYNEFVAYGGGANRNGVRIYGGVFKSNANVDLNSTTTIQTNQWYHGVVTYDGTTRKIYVNGVLEASDTPTLAVQTNSSYPLTIGKYPDGSKYTLGKLKDVSFFNYALSDGGVAIGASASGSIGTLYGGGKPFNPMALSSPPVAYYPLGNSAHMGSNYITPNGALQDYVFDFIPNDSIDTNFTLPNYNSYSISVWYKKDRGTVGALPGGDYYLWGNAASGGANKPRTSVRFNDTNELRIITGDGTVYFQSPDLNVSTLLLDGKWHHILTTTVSGEIKLYIDGDLQATHTNSNIITGIVAETSYRIGQSGYNAGYLTESLLSNFQIFNTALSATDAGTLYNYGSPIQTLANIPQNSNLKAWYKLDATEIYNSTSTEWSVENNANPSAYSSSLSFDGSSDIVDAGTGLTITRDLTLSGWVKFTSTNSDGSTVISKHITPNSPPYYTYRLYISSNKAAFRIGTTTHTIIIGGTDINDGNWHHILGTYDGSNINLYVDGVSDATAVAASGNLNTAVKKTTIGAVINGSTSSISSNTVFNGELSNSQVFNTALPETGSNSIENLYNNGTPLADMSSFSSLVSWWKLNNTTTGIQDSAGSNNGTNNGATEYPGFVNTLAGDSLGMSQSNLVQSDLLTTSSYSPYALSFDGNDYITLGSNNYGFPSVTSAGQTLDNLSISVWFKNQGGSGNQVLLTWWASGSGGQTYLDGFLQFNPSNGVVRFGDDWQIAYTFPSIPSDWTHMTAVKTTDNAYVYVNGSLVSTKGSSLSFGINRECRFGGNQGAGEYFIGDISNISLWEYNLSASQVKEIYNEGLPSNLHNFSGTAPVAWWQLGSNSSWTSPAWTVLDEIGSNDGTSQSMLENAIVDGVGTSGNGVSTNMSLANNISGSSPNGEGNSLSVNMTLANIAGGVN